MEGERKVRCCKCSLNPVVVTLVLSYSQSKALQPCSVSLWSTRGRTTTPLASVDLAKPNLAAKPTPVFQALDSAGKAPNT